MRDYWEHAKLLRKVADSTKGELCKINQQGNFREAVLNPFLAA